MAMQNLDLEEQEKLEELKAWWRQYGNLILMAIIAASLAVAGWGGWRWYQRNANRNGTACRRWLRNARNRASSRSRRAKGGRFI